MTTASMKTVAGRVRRLEVRFRSTVEAMRKAAVPSPAEAIIQLLAAGEWQCALKLLELPQKDVWPTLQSIERRGAKRVIDIDLRDLTRTRETLVAAVPPELRWKIARQLLAADTAMSQGLAQFLETRG